MSSERKFFRCTRCGQLVGVIQTGVGTLVCCDQPMDELIPNTVEAAKEKHVPVVTRDGNFLHVQVGSTIHPMLSEHYIQWIYVYTKTGGYRHAFQPGETPEATFCIQNEDPVAVYEYCNLHGLWMTEL